MQRYKRKIALGLKFIKESHKNPIALAWDYYTLKRKKGLMFNEYYSYCFDSINYLLEAHLALQLIPHKNSIQFDCFHFD